MARRHPEPVDLVSVPVYRDLDPVLTVGGIADYFGVQKQLVNMWTVRNADWPAPFASPPSGKLYLTADVIEWAKRHERKRAEGPRPAGDPRPPSVQKAKRRKRAA